MTVRISKPSENLRSLLTERDFSRVPFQKMPAGSVIQVVKSTLDSPVEGTGNFDIFSGSISPKLPNSDILISVYLQWSTIDNDGSDWGIRLKRNGDIILGESQNSYFLSGGGVDTAERPTTPTNDRYLVRYLSKQDIDNSRPPGTTALTYTLRVRFGDQDGNKRIVFQQDGWQGTGGESQRSNCTMILTEVSR